MARRISGPIVIAASLLLLAVASVALLVIRQSEAMEAARKAPRALLIKWQSQDPETARTDPHTQCLRVGVQPQLDGSQVAVFANSWVAESPLIDVDPVSQSRDGRYVVWERETNDGYGCWGVYDRETGRCIAPTRPSLSADSVWAGDTLLVDSEPTTGGGYVHLNIDLPRMRIRQAVPIDDPALEPDPED